MKTNRVDGWTLEEENVLVDLILCRIQSGGPQRSAFQEAEQQLKRTTTACRNHWNRTLRKKYMSKIENAMKERRMNREADLEPTFIRSDGAKRGETQAGNLIELLSSEIQEVKQNLQTKTTSDEQLGREFELFHEELSNLMSEINLLRIELLKMTTDIASLRHDYMYLSRSFENVSR